jgi:hypothetical protein
VIDLAELKNWGSIIEVVSILYLLSYRDLMIISLMKNFIFEILLCFAGESLDLIKKEIMLDVVN